MKMLRPWWSRLPRSGSSCCPLRRRPPIRPRSRSPARCSPRPAVAATGIRPAPRRTSPTTRATTSGRAPSSLPAGELRVQGGAEQRLGRELRPPRESRTAPTSRSTSPRPASVKFYYDHKTHWATDNKSSVIAVAAGSFQSELGCPGDWEPDCLRSWLEDPDGDGIYTFETTALPAGSYETKVAINESWDENYGPGGAPDGANIPFTVPVDNAKVTFTYDATIARPDDHGRRPRPVRRRPRRALAFRPRAQGLPRHGAQHDLEGLVHGRERRPQRRLLPDGRQHERRDAAVRRHRRLDVHRPPDARHDLHGRGDRRHAAGWRAR